MKTTKKLIGQVGVDAGLIWIGDPCYVLHTENPPKSIGKDWGDFCDKLHKNADEHSTSFNFDMGHEGLGVCVSSGYGDGLYPVYAQISDEGKFGKRVKSVTIKFF